VRVPSECHLAGLAKEVNARPVKVIMIQVELEQFVHHNECSINAVPLRRGTLKAPLLHKQFKVSRSSCKGFISFRYFIFRFYAVKIKTTFNRRSKQEKKIEAISLIILHLQANIVSCFVFLSGSNVSLSWNPSSLPSSNPNSSSTHHFIVPYISYSTINSDVQDNA
jgi:hypothetical protein